jgi:hypothetical protein
MKSYCPRFCVACELHLKGLPLKAATAVLSGATVTDMQLIRSSSKPLQEHLRHRYRFQRPTL